MTSCIKSDATSNLNDQYGFKVVPELLTDITPEWCEKALQKGSTISKQTKVIGVETKPLTNETTGVKDGGGMSGSTLAKLTLTYGGYVTGNEPSTMVCKITRGTPRDINMIWRMIFFGSLGFFDEYCCRQEVIFFQDVAPSLKDTSYSHVKTYFIGMEDRGDSNFVQYVLLNQPSRIKSVVLMEDLTGWISSAVGHYCSKQQMVKCLKNVAILHAKFWGHEDIGKFKVCKTDKDYRPSRYNKGGAMMRKKLVSSTEAIQRKIEKVLSGEWANHAYMSLKKDAILPDWLTVEATVNGNYPILQDRLVKDALAILASRIPKYNRLKLKHFITKEPQTLLHGDFHGGNHMYYEDEKIKSLDFQWIGGGLVVIEVFYLIMMSFGIHNFDEIEELTKEYHNALIENGVQNYSWEEFQNETQMILVENSLSIINNCSMFKPQGFINMMSKFVGEEKAEEFNLIIENCAFIKWILLLTSLYVKDKDKFLTTTD